jgi:hypothetical protein
LPSSVVSLSVCLSVSLKTVLNIRETVLTRDHARSLLCANKNKLVLFVRSCECSGSFSGGLGFWGVTWIWLIHLVEFLDFLDFPARILRVIYLVEFFGFGDLLEYCDWFILQWSSLDFWVWTVEWCVVWESICTFAASLSWKATASYFRMLRISIVSSCYYQYWRAAGATSISFAILKSSWCFQHQLRRSSF